MSDYNYSKILLEFVTAMKKVILDLEALIENHPICSESFVSYLEQNQNSAQQDSTEEDNTEQDATEQENTKQDNTEQDTTELGNDSQADSQAEPKGNRKRPCPKE